MAYPRLDPAGVRYQLLDLGEGSVQRLLGDICHEHICAFFGKQNASLKADATVPPRLLVSHFAPRISHILVGH